jgi:hypothetical protein
VNALAKPDVGQYLNDHFISAFQKVATFKIVNGQKQGGNVASYFCTPDGQVLDAVAGPVDGPTLLREARWVIETRNLAALDGKANADGLKAVVRKAHAERLQQEYGVASKVPARPEFTSEDVATVLDRGRGLANDGRIHLLLSTYPLAPIGKVYRPIFERVLNEAVSTTPVQQGDLALGRVPPSRVLQATPEDERESRREEQVLKARNDPPESQVQSGQALNVLLTDLRRLDEKGVELPEQGLNAADLGRIRVVASGHGDVGPALLLQDPLPWPASLAADDFAADRVRVELALQTALAQAVKGPVARDAFKAVVDAADRMDQKVTAKVRANTGWSATEAIEAGTFLSRFKESAAVLQQPDVGGYLSGAYAAKGKTVHELVQNMTANGLRFAPALPGDEPAYRAVQRALAGCDAKAHAAAE